MSELDKSIEVLKIMKENLDREYLNCRNSNSIDIVLSTIEQLRDKVNKDIEYYTVARKSLLLPNVDMWFRAKKEVLDEILEIIGG